MPHFSYTQDLTSPHLLLHVAQQHIHQPLEIVLLLELMSFETVGCWALVGSASVSRLLHPLKSDIGADLLKSVIVVATSPDKSHCSEVIGVGHSTLGLTKCYKSIWKVSNWSLYSIVIRRLNNIVTKAVMLRDKSVHKLLQVSPGLYGMKNSIIHYAGVNFMTSQDIFFELYIVKHLLQYTVWWMSFVFLLVRIPKECWSFSSLDAVEQLSPKW